MMKKFLSKTLVFLLAFLTVFSCFAPAVFAAAGEGISLAGEDEKTKLDEIQELLDANDYLEYELLHKDKPNGVDKITILGSAYNPEKTDATVYQDTYLGKENVILVSELGDVIWDFEAQNSGKYHIFITYAPIVEYDGDGDGQVDFKSNSATIKRALLLDGVYPFKQSRYIEMSRVWMDQAPEGETKPGRDPFVLDNEGNEIKPQKVEAPEWRTIVAQDSTGYITEPFLYYIEAGSHTLSLAEVQECVAIEKIEIQFVASAPSYEEYLAANSGKPDQSSEGQIVMQQAEIVHRTSTNIIYPIYDRSSAATSPQNAYNIFLNTVGGEKWQTAGQWVSWKFSVTKSGYYNITPRFRQSFAEGMYVTRSLKIDGVTPFAEANHLRFKYDDGWQLKALTDGVIDPATGEERALRFYLEEGEHELEMWVSLGDMAEVLSSVENSLSNINEYYLQILMLTGSEPDEYRDYYFSRYMPEVIKGLGEEAKRLYAISAELEKINGTKGSDSVTLDNVALLLERMSKDEDLIAPSFSELKDYIGNLGTWIMTARNQPLEVDYILFVPASVGESEDAEDLLEEEGYYADASFWAALVHEFKQFLMSWISDYSSYGVRTAEGTEDYPTIEVWTTSGRDQSTIMRSLISDSFTQQHNVAVELKLVAGGSLLPATLSGSGPDVNLTVGSVTVINYAIRSAVKPINPAGYQDEEGDTAEEKAYKAKCREIFSDYEEVVAANFEAAATVPLELYGVAYGLPETESFSMMFYRSDILLQLGLDIPETWDDVYNMLPTLQTNNLQFGYHESLAGLLIMLYQRGEQLYREGLNTEQYQDNPMYDPTFAMSVNLDSNAALETFKEMCELYTMYGFPYSYNFVNRFRTGEMPVAVAGYTTYSQLTIFAPELRGLWGFTILPGTPVVDKNGDPVLNEDGTQKIDHTADTNVTGVIMMSDCEEIEAAWEFMKWWTSTDTQATYGQEYYALLGASGQYATANKNALLGMSWTADERKEIENQFDWLQATPEMPGGYIVARYVEFAFLRAYDDNDDPVEAMLDYIDAINAEISRKRAEFGLPTLEDFKTEGAE